MIASPGSLQYSPLFLNFNIGHNNRTDNVIVSMQLSMWRCSDELKQRALQLDAHAKKEAKHYVGEFLIHSLLKLLDFVVILSILIRGGSWRF